MKRYFKANNFKVNLSVQAFKHDYFSLFPDRYLLCITMIFGATVAGNICMFVHCACIINMAILTFFRNDK